MNNNKNLFIFLLATLSCACTHNTGTEKHQGKRDNIIDVHKKVKKIEINEDEIIIGGIARLYLIDNYLIIEDVKSYDKLIHLFDKNHFTHLASLGNRGQGPNEITNIGHIGINEVRREFYVSDHGKQKIFAYNIDSVLANSDYQATVKMEMNKGLFPSKYQYFNDTLSMGVVIEPIGNSDFDQFVAKWNMNTGEIKPMKHNHPDIKKKRISFAASLEKGIYVECYAIRDLMTIFDLDGNLKYAVYGPKWNSQWDNIHYYCKSEFCNDKILATYSGGDWNTNEYNSTQFLVFNLTGDYIKTIETGYMISDFCYDKKNNRIIMALDDAEIQFAYLELDSLLTE